MSRIFPVRGHQFEPQVNFGFQPVSFGFEQSDLITALQASVCGRSNQLLDIPQMVYHSLAQGSSRRTIGGEIKFSIQKFVSESLHCRVIAPLQEMHLLSRVVGFQQSIATFLPQSGDFLCVLPANLGSRFGKTRRN
jgi:hypothetical protein